MPRDYEDYLQTLTAEAPDNKWSEALQSMWYDAKDNWGSFP